MPLGKAPRPQNKPGWDWGVDQWVLNQRRINQLLWRSKTLNGCLALRETFKVWIVGGTTGRVCSHIGYSGQGFSLLLPNVHCPAEFSTISFFFKALQDGGPSVAQQRDTDVCAWSSFNLNVLKFNANTKCTSLNTSWVVLLLEDYWV